MAGIRGEIAGVFGQWRRCWKTLAWADVVYKIVAVIVFATLSGALFRGLLATFGEAVLTDQAMFMSLKLEAVTKMKALRPTWKVGLLMSVSAGDLKNIEAELFDCVPRMSQQ